MKRFIYIAFIIFTCYAPMAIAAVEPVAPVIPPANEEQPPAPPAPTCVVAGTVYCSEYGSRYRESLRLVLVRGAERYESTISDTNGSFAVSIPCGGRFDVRIEFEDKGMAVGSITLPDSPQGTVFGLEIKHTGSYLEFVRDIREGVKEDDIIYKLELPQQQ
jgi:hypothetical protein